MKLLMNNDGLGQPQKAWNKALEKPLMDGKFHSYQNCRSGLKSFFGCFFRRLCFDSGSPLESIVRLDPRSAQLLFSIIQYFSEPHCDSAELVMMAPPLKKLLITSTHKLHNTTFYLFLGYFGHELRQFLCTINKLNMCRLAMQTLKSCFISCELTLYILTFRYTCR